MRRRTLDALLSIGGAIVAAVLLVAGGLLLWAGNFANNTVSQQLADQRITMPSGAAIADPQIKPYLEQFAGQPLTTGAQAQAYADHYILVHMVLRPPRPLRTAGRSRAVTSGTLRSGGGSRCSVRCRAGGRCRRKPLRRTRDGTRRSRPGS